MDTIAVIRKLREIELLVQNEAHPFFEKLMLDALEYAIQVQRGTRSPGVAVESTSFADAEARRPRT